MATIVEYIKQGKINIGKIAVEVPMPFIFFAEYTLFFHFYGHSPKSFTLMATRVHWTYSVQNSEIPLVNAEI